MRDVGSPRDAARPRLAAVPAIVAERRERRRIAVVQRRLRDGNRPTSAVYAAAMTAARRDAPRGAVS